MVYVRTDEEATRIFFLNSFAASLKTKIKSLHYKSAGTRNLCFADEYSILCVTLKNVDFFNEVHESQF